MASPATCNIEIVRGDDYSLTISIETAAGEPVDLSGRACTAMIRKGVDGALIASFVADVSGAATGEIVLSLTAATTAAFTPGTYRFDAQLAGPVETFVAGRVEVKGDVTHA